MAGKTYDVLMPRGMRAKAGAEFADGSYVRRQGEIPARLMAARLPGGSIGTHAAALNGTHALHADTPLTSQTKDTEPIIAARDTASAKAKTADEARAAVLAAVTCKFCQTRLIAAGIMSADALPAASIDAAYAADYGTRGDVAEQLAAIDARKAAADKAAAKAAKAAAKAAADKAAARKAAKADKAKA